MENIILQLKPIKTENSEMKIDLPLYEEVPQANLKRILIEQHLKVFSDVKYSYSLDNKGYTINKLFINGNEVKDSALIFQSLYGFAQISVEISTDKGISCLFYSDYLTIYLKDNEVQNRSLKKMAEYVYINHGKFLYDLKNKPDDKIDSIKYKHPKNLETQRRLIEHIVGKYNMCLPYFRHNAKSKIVNSGKVDSVNKLTIITSNTLQFMAQHPEELKLTNYNTGIKFGRNYYLPEKTLIIDKQLSYDIYENRVIVGFLYYIFNRLKRIIENNEILLSNCEKSEKPYGYSSSVQFIYEDEIESLNLENDKLQKLHKEIKRLYLEYKGIFPVKNDPMTHIPKYTNIFAALKQYNEIYMVIRDWFKMGDYYLRKEEFMLYSLVNDKLYEYYVLLKILNAIKDNGYNYDGEKSLAFKYYFTHKSKYKNTDYNNTFYFTTKALQINCLLSTCYLCKKLPC